MSRSADKYNRGLVEFLSICQVLCACELPRWPLYGDGSDRYFSKVSNAGALGEYPEKFGFVSLSYLPRAR